MMNLVYLGIWEGHGESHESSLSRNVGMTQKKS